MIIHFHKAAIQDIIGDNYKIFSLFWRLLGKQTEGVYRQSTTRILRIGKSYFVGSKDWRSSLLTILFWHQTQKFK